MKSCSYKIAAEEYAYITSELPRRVEDAFSVDSRIVSVDNWVFNEENDGTLKVSFDVTTVYGTMSKEMVL